MDRIDKIINKALENTAGIPEDFLDVYKAMVMNQRKELERIREQTTTANIDRVATVFLPAVKKLARDSVINKIVGVQPIKDRVAVVQFIDYVYSSDYADGGITAGESAVDKMASDFNYSNDPGEGQNITRGIDFVLREEGVKARQRKLLGKWTFEASTAPTGTNIEQQITKALAAKIVEEINFEIITDLFNNATGGSVTWTAPLPTDTAEMRNRKEKELYYAIVDVASTIYDKSGRYPNWILCNPRTAAYLKRSGDFVGLGSPGNVSSIKRLFYQGTYEEEFDVYVVRNLPVNDILVGFKGNSEIEVGAIYAPYIPLIVMDSFFNVENWTWVRSVGSFYAKAFPMTSMYGKVRISMSSP